MAWRYAPTVEDDDGSEVWTIHGVYDMGDDGDTHTVDPATPRGTTREELIAGLRMMLDDAIAGPVLDLRGD